MFIHLPFVYYPGAGHDFEVLTHFTQQHGSTNFVFTDYDPDMAQPTGVGTLAVAAKTMGTPDVIVLQDHGMGGNWDQFGGPSRLYETAQTHGCPPYVFLAENTEGWPGYSVPESADFDGQFGSAGNKRALCAIQ
jgi:hypothetical protein